MPRPHSPVAAAAALTLLGGALLVAVQTAPQDPPSAVAATPAGVGPAAAPSAASKARATKVSTPAAPGPPAGTLGITRPSLDRYSARRVDWDDVLARSKPLPRPDARCTAAWKASGKDSRLAWSSASFWCLDGLRGRGWKPQGIAGSGTTESYRIGGRDAATRNIVLTSWYSRRSEKGLFAANRSGQSVTRLVVVDLDRERYSTVELVRPDGVDGLRNLDSHGSGLAWAGQYLYSSSQSWLWMYNADDLLQIDGHFVLPAVARWAVSGSGSMSSISVDRSRDRDQLVAINYTRTGPSRVQAFDLTRHGLLATRAGDETESLQLSTWFGEKPRVIRSVAWRTVPGTHYQGVGLWGHYSFVNSSALQTSPDTPRIDAMVVQRGDTVLQEFPMPGGNVESVYVDTRRRTYTSLTEGGSQFLFVLPLRQLIQAARE